jgi:hypothetical protein
LSRGLWWWLNDLMVRGIAAPLEESDVYNLRPDLDACRLADDFEREWNNEKEEFARTHPTKKNPETEQENVTGAASDEAKQQDGAMSASSSGDATAVLPSPSVTEDAAGPGSSVDGAAAASLKQQPVDAVINVAAAVEGDAADKQKDEKTPLKEGEEASAKKADAAGKPAAPEPAPSIAAALFRIVRREFWLAALCKAIADGLSLLQPILLQYLLDFLVDWSFWMFLGKSSQPPAWHGFVLAAAMGLCPFVAGILENAHQYLMTLIGFRVRSMLVQAMYRKSLLLSPRARAQHSQGKIVSVMASDTFLIDQFAQFCHMCWSALALIIVAVALLIRAIGWPAVIGVSQARTNTFLGGTWLGLACSDVVLFVVFLRCLCAHSPSCSCA